MKFFKHITLLIVLVMLVGTASGCKNSEGGSGSNQGNGSNGGLVLHYSLDESSGSLAKESVSGKDYTINYVFNESNADTLFKEPNDPLRSEAHV